MPKFRIPCNWDLKLLDVLDSVGKEQVADLFGMLPSHVAGGGRPSAALPQVDESVASRFMAEAKARGYAFSYLFNAPCLDAMEYTEEWRKRFVEHLDWAVESGAEAATVAVPYLIEVMKKRHPGLRVAVSSYARVNSVRRAAYFQELGADEIVLDPITANRNFRLLESMAKEVDCTLTLIVNGICLYQCPFAEYHGVLMGHSSQEGHPSGGRYEEYPFYNCTLRKLKDPAEIVRAAFIRPEDLRMYEEIGISNFKLVDRSRPTDWLAGSIKAYVDGRYDGDLLDILNFPKGFLAFLFKQAGIEGVPVFPRVDNRKLDSFLERLREVDCLTDGCSKCDVCAEYARRAVEVPEGVGSVIGLLESVRKGLMFA